LASDAQPAFADIAPCCRLSFRGGRAAADAAAAAFGVRLPAEPCRAAHSGERAALWLGRDEWLLLAPLADRDPLIGSIAAALGPTPHALVDVSERSLALAIQGRSATDILAVGCPIDLDLSVFPVDMCTRTLYGKAEIVLWRRGPSSFRLEVWRSFLPYVKGLLDEAARDHVGAG
jgi:sarcosine oxidase subunit gamma